MQPLWRELDVGVPFSYLFPLFLNDPYPVFLDSSLTHPRLGRFSYIASQPFAVLRAKNGRIWIEGDQARSPFDGDPFDALRSALSELSMEAVADLPPFQGGAVGYFGYDLAHHVERLPRTTVDDVGIPDMVVGLYDWVLSHDHGSGRAWVVSVPRGPDGEAGAAARIEELVRRVREGVRTRRGDGETGERGEEENGNRHGRTRTDADKDGRMPIRSSFSREGYLAAVRRAKEYIAAGDIYQVNLSQRLEAALHTTPWELYRSLRRVSPVPYGAYLGLGDFAVASASPELFLRKEGRRVETRPIKGTRPRGRTAGEDQRLAEELLASEKDRAENVMIVDLLRNDLGKACSVGSVRWPELFSLESYSTVHHLVSAVVGEVADGQDAVSLLKACFPGGSITGCPKIRAMEIIDELEPTQRGVYCGSIGFVGFNGNMDTSIAIRTVVAKEGRAYFQVGGAIVADSDPEAEYQETLDKARAVMLALSECGGAGVRECGSEGVGE